MRPSSWSRRSADTDRQRPWSTDLTRRPGDRRGVGQGELRDTLQPDLERDTQLHPGQVRSDAAVDAQTEGGVPVDRAVDDHLVSALELLGITVGGREGQ